MKTPLPFIYLLIAIVVLYFNALTSLYDSDFTLSTRFFVLGTIVAVIGPALIKSKS